MMTGLLILLCLVVLILVIVGGNLGLKHKIVVYDSRADLHLTCVSLIVWAISGGIILAACKDEANVGVLLLMLLLGGILSISPIRRSWRANKTVWHTILSVLTKYAMIVVITMLGIITIQSAFGAFEDIKKKKYEDAAANALAAVGGAWGFMRVRKLINNLIAESPSREPQESQSSIVTPNISLPPKQATTSYNELLPTVAPVSHMRSQSRKVLLLGFLIIGICSVLVGISIYVDYWTRGDRWFLIDWRAFGVRW